MTTINPEWDGSFKSFWNEYKLIIILFVILFILLISIKMFNCNIGDGWIYKCRFIEWIKFK